MVMTSAMILTVPLYIFGHLSWRNMLAIPFGLIGMPLLGWIAIVLSVIAVTISVITWTRAYRLSAYKYLADLWNDVLSKCCEHPAFIDLAVTENYRDRMGAELKLQYDAFCYKAWGLVESIVAKRFHKNTQFSAIIEWVAAYHRTWLDSNPVFFPMKRFWDVVDAARRTPHAIFRRRPLPEKEGAIDWDVVSPEYHRYILGPFAPEMADRDSSGRIRNPLLEHLLARPSEDLARLAIAVFGCGPGNLLPHLKGTVEGILGVDIAQAALDEAVRVAARHNISFEAVEADLRELDLGRQFDVIVCVNAILPRQRADVVRMLSNVRKHLRPNGHLMAILPSFDTTTYLMSLWHTHYAALFDSPEHADRIIGAFAARQQADESTCSYADDGRHVQCFHTPETIQREFGQAGLRIIRGPEKVLYPWELCKRFDYGYFPEKDEIWDWYVIAERSS
jgi:2-polyprenyl-3-methyl-5-hydroxy-6-metoxy-1,4-benzoquinol methylase